MKIKATYYYIFYVLYIFWDKISVPRFWSDAKATFSIIVLQVLTTSSLFAYNKTFFDKSSRLGEGVWEYVVMLAVFFFPNYFIFIYKDRHQNIVHYFNQWPKRRRRKWNIVTGIFIMLIIINFIFSFYLFFARPN